MESFVKDLFNPNWWVSVVIVGFLINLASSYAKPWLDKLLSRYSEKRKRRVDAQSEKLERDITFLLSNPSELTNKKIELLRREVGIYFGFGLSFFALILSVIDYNVVFSHRQSLLTIPVTLDQTFVRNIFFLMGLASFIGNLFTIKKMAHEWWILHLVEQYKHQMREEKSKPITQSTPIHTQ